MVFRRSLSAIAAIFFVTSANAEVLECRLQPNANAGGWVTDLYYFEYQAGSDTGTVVDGVIQYEEGGPISAKITENTEKKIVFTWKLSVFNQGQNVTMRYRAAHFKGNRSITVKAFPDASYVGEFLASGTCKKVQA
jgi:hypothetical protein